MSEKYPLAIGRTRRMRYTSDDLVIEEILTKLRSLFTMGQTPPNNTTPGTLYIQYAADSYSRIWVKDGNGVWR